MRADRSEIPRVQRMAGQTEISMDDHSVMQKVDPKVCSRVDQMVIWKVGQMADLKAPETAGQRETLRDDR